MHPRLSIYTLLGANCIPLLGVLFFSWDLSQILFIYWLETGIIGVSTFAKIIYSKKEPTKFSSQKSSFPPVVHTSKWFFAPFFLVHFGIFMSVHAVFLFGFFFSESVPWHAGGMWLVTSVGALCISHTISFVRNYIGKKEYLQYAPDILMLQPYKRIVVMQFTIIFGGFFVELLGSPVYALCVLVIGKIFLDIKTHVKEHASPV